jgi:hypothetical protein
MPIIIPHQSKVGINNASGGQAGLEEAAKAEARLKQVEEGGNQVLECAL